MRTASALVVALALLAPGATGAHGAWLAGSGQHEPSTTYDSGAFMFPFANDAIDPATGLPVERVYFNGFFVTAPAPGVAVRLDLNLDGGNVLSPVAYMGAAVLGFWRDCNRDGYVGLKSAPAAYASLGAYPTGLADVDETLCPPGSPYLPINPTTGQKNGVVDELRWIGPGAGCDPHEAGCPGSGTTPSSLCLPPPGSPVPPVLCVQGFRPVTNGVNDVTDGKARVWADWSVPGGKHVPQSYLRPLPRGTFHDSDGSLRYVDEQTLGTLSGALGGAWASKPNVGACDQPHPALLGGPDGTCGAWPLWQTKRAVNDTTCSTAESKEGKATPGCWEPDPLLTTWDLEHDHDGDGNACNDGFAAGVENPTAPGTWLLRVGVPDVAVSHNPNALADGSLSGTLKHQQRALNHTSASVSKSEPGGCGTRGGVEDPFEWDAPESTYRHLAPSMTFNFTADTHVHHLERFGYYGVSLYATGNVLGGPSGVTSTNGPGWFSQDQWTSRPPRDGWGAIRVAHATFYADVSPEAIAKNPLASAEKALPSGAQDAHTYGSDACVEITTGPSVVDPTTLWECSLTEWKKARDALPHSSPKRWDAPLLGDRYDLRDVDCFDNRVSDANAFSGDLLAEVRVGIAACDAHAP